MVLRCLTCLSLFHPLPLASPFPLPLPLSPLAMWEGEAGTAPLLPSAQPASLPLREAFRIRFCADWLDELELVSLHHTHAHKRTHTHTRPSLQACTRSLLSIRRASRLWLLSVFRLLVVECKTAAVASAAVFSLALLSLTAFCLFPFQ